MTHSDYKLTIEDCRVGDEFRGINCHCHMCESNTPIFWTGKMDSHDGDLLMMTFRDGTDAKGYPLSELKNLSAERRHAEAQAARPAWVRIVKTKCSYPDGTIIKVVDWDGEGRPIVRDRIGAKFTLYSTKWEPVPVAEPVEQEPKNEYAELRGLCRELFDVAPKWTKKHGEQAGNSAPLLWGLLDAYDAMKAERDKLKDDIEALAESDNAAAKFMADQGDRIAELERELAECRRVNGELQKLVDDASLIVGNCEIEKMRSRAAAFQVATSGPNSPQEIYGEVKAAPKVEPSKEYALKWYLLGLCYGDNFASSAISEFESKFKTELAQGGSK